MSSSFQSSACTKQSFPCPQIYGPAGSPKRFLSKSTTSTTGKGRGKNRSAPAWSTSFIVNRDHPLRAMIKVAEPRPRNHAIKARTLLIRSSSSRGSGTMILFKIRNMKSNCLCAERRRISCSWETQTGTMWRISPSARITIWWKMLLSPSSA
jgi:hypothetical protein